MRAQAFFVDHTVLVMRNVYCTVHACKKEVMIGKQLVNNALQHQKSVSGPDKMEEAWGSINVFTKRGDWDNIN